MGTALFATRWSPVPLPPHASEQDISRFPVDTTRNAVNQGGVGGYNNGANWRQNPTTQPFTCQPGPVYGCHLNSTQEYRADAGWLVQITNVAPAFPQPYLLAGTNRSGGVATQNAVQARMASLIAMRQRLARQKPLKR